MATIKETLAAVVSMTVTNLHSIAAAAAWQSAAVDNSANLYLDALVQVTIVYSPTGATTADKGLTIYAYGTVDGGTTYTESASGTESAYTMAADRQLRFVGFIPAVTVSATYKAGPFSVAAAFGGVLPEKWGLVIYNNGGFTLSTGNLVKYQGVYPTVV